MKITDPGVIKNGEKDLIDSLKKDLDLDAVKEIIKSKISAAALSSKGGEIVVYNNRIAFRMDFDLCISGSLMFDRQGNYIPGSDAPFDQNDTPYEKDDGDLSDTGIDTGGNIKTEEKIDPDLPDYELDPLDGLENLDDLEEFTTQDPDSETELKESDILIENDNIIIDDLGDDDITDILKESRDFWEKKQDS